MQEGLASCPEILRLQASLGREREAVHSFLFTVCDEVRLAPRCQLHAGSAHTHVGR